VEHHHAGQLDPRGDVEHAEDLTDAKRRTPTNNSLVATQPSVFRNLDFTIGDVLGPLIERTHGAEGLEGAEHGRLRAPRE
jgi:hypothetical protein